MEIANCPCCGSTASEDWEDSHSGCQSYYFISCDGEDCGLRTQSTYASLSDEVINQWNRRVTR